jgi:hypothetical protein
MAAVIAIAAGRAKDLLCLLIPRSLPRERTLIADNGLAYTWQEPLAVIWITKEYGWGAPIMVTAEGRTG